MRGGCQGKRPLSQGNPLSPAPPARYSHSMSGFLLVLLGVTLLAVLGTLLAGVLVMARGGETDRRWANRLMRLRVGLQGLALALFLLILMTQA